MSAFFSKAAEGWRHVVFLVCIFLFIFGFSFFVVNMDFKHSPESVASAVAAIPSVNRKLEVEVNKNTDFKNVSFLSYVEWAEKYGLAGGSEALDADPDEDGLANRLEYAHLTNPKNPDSDSDGFRDEQEILNGYDPNAGGESRPAVEIAIKKIGVSVPVIWSKSEDEKSMAEDLKRGVIHFPKTASPGLTGNMIISGHSSNYAWAEGDYNYVFKDMNDLENGDIITVKSIQANGRVLLYNYKVAEKYVTTPDDPRIFQETDRPVLTLSTCWPLGTAFKRLIVKADLAE